MKRITEQRDMTRITWERSWKKLVRKLDREGLLKK